MVNVRTLRNFIGLAYFGMKHSLRVIINSRKEDIKKEKHIPPLDFSNDILRYLNVKVKAEGIERIVEPPAIIVGNHTTYLDIPSLIYVFSSKQKGIYFVAKKALFEYPVFGEAMKKFGMIQVDYSNLKKTSYNINKAIKMIKNEGAYLVMYPEGKRTTNRDYQMLNFKNGPFKYSVENNFPIIRVASYGGQEILPRWNLSLTPGTMHLKILPAIHPKNFKGSKGEKIRKMSECARISLEEEIKNLKNNKQKGL